MSYNYRLERTVAPSGDPVVSFEEQAFFMREIEDDANTQALVNSLVLAAEDAVERITRRALRTQTWKKYLDCFGCEILLSKTPVASVTSIVYTDTAGDSQTMDASDYVVLKGQDAPASITLAQDSSWPSTISQRGAIEVTFVSGYGDSDDVPDQIKTIIKMMVAHWYENREITVEGVSTAKVPNTVELLLNPYMIKDFPNENE